MPGQVETEGFEVASAGKATPEVTVVRVPRQGLSRVAASWGHKPAAAAPEQKGSSQKGEPRCGSDSETCLAAGRNPR